MHVLNWQDLTPQDTKGIEKRCLAGANGTLVQVDIPAGTQAPRHSHPHEQIVHVVSGTGTLETSEGTKRFQAGSLFHFPADTWHSAVFETPTVLVETNFNA